MMETCPTVSGLFRLTLTRVIPTSEVVRLKAQTLASRPGTRDTNPAGIRIPR
jgi:hypothetical protein